MKQTIFTTLLLITVAIVSSCRKDSYPTIKQYDQSEIQSYISANGLTMKRDTAGGDTTGIYYQILTAGTGARLQYSDTVSFVFTVKTLDGKFVSTDTIQANHFSDYLGHLTSHSLPYGLELALINDLQYRGTRARVLIPSRLAYGVSGYSSGGSSTLGNKIPGNESLDYYINVIDDQPKYDDMVINNYIKSSGLTGKFTKTASGLYYMFDTQPVGTDPITDLSTVTVTYTGQLFNAAVFDEYNTSGGTTFNIVDLTAGAAEGLKLCKTGALITLLIPSKLGYGGAGTSGSTGTNVPAFACLRFDFQVLSTTP